MTYGTRETGSSHPAPTGWESDYLAAAEDADRIRQAWKVKPLARTAADRSVQIARLDPTEGAALLISAELRALSTVVAEMLRRQETLD